MNAENKSGEQDEMVQQIPLARFEALERRLLDAERSLRATERRLQGTWVCAFIGALGAFVLGSSPEARAQFGTTLQSLQNQINALTPRVTALETKTAPLSVSGTSFFITGKNVFIQDGVGRTDSLSGLGNLTIGYNRTRPIFITNPNVRTGSHNLILGDQNNYSRFGGLVVGFFNTISGDYASISGGDFNTASAPYASVSGGESNTASGPGSSSVSGGSSNVASELYASVSGGGGNIADAVGASLSGGFGRGIIPFLGGPDFSYTWRAGNFTAGP